MRPHLSPTVWAGFSDGFRSTLDPFKPAPEPLHDEMPGGLDEPGSAHESADRDGAGRHDLPVPV